jgi:anaerobic ribonucleoside-triphosphate reductase
VIDQPYKEDFSDIANQNSEILTPKIDSMIAYDETRIQEIELKSLSIKTEMENLRNQIIKTKSVNDLFKELDRQNQLSNGVGITKRTTHPRFKQAATG